MKQYSRRTFLKAAVSSGCGIFGGAAYTRLWEPHALEITSRTIALSPGRMQRPLRLLHVSDFHASDVVPLEYLAYAAEMTAAARPDLILITGDFITHRILDMDGYRQVLARFSAAAPCFAVPGNHDGGRWAASAGGYNSLAPLEDLLSTSGITLLRNESRMLQLGGQQIRLVGLGDLWSGDLDPQRAFAALEPFGRQASQLKNAAVHPPVVALSHNPDSCKTLLSYPWDLLLCGHTHGGQLVLPLLGIRPFLPIQEKRFAEGLHRVANRSVFVTRGVGNLHGLRFNCPPEISTLTLC